MAYVTFISALALLLALGGASATSCNLGSPTSTSGTQYRSLGSDFTPAADHASLVSSTGFLEGWDFEGLDGLLTTTGPAFSMSCIKAVNAKLVNPSLPGNPVFGLRALASGSTTRLVLDNVQIFTTCEDIYALQDFLCSSFHLSGSLKVFPGLIQVLSWQDDRTQITNANFTCPYGRQPTCYLAGAATATDVMDAIAVYQPSVAAPIVVVLSANITFPPDVNSSLLPIRHNVTVVPSSALSSLLPTVIDFNLGSSIFEIQNDSSIVMVIMNLTCVNLATSYFSPALPYHHFGLLSERVWAFRRYQPQLHLINTVIVVPPDALEYSKYWVTFLLSPVPEAQAKAAWLQIFDLKVSRVTEDGIVTASSTTYTTVYTNTRTTDALPGYPVVPQRTGLQQLQDESVPLTSVTQLLTEADVLEAITSNVTQADDLGRRYLLLISNVTIGNGGWPENGTIQLPGSLVLGHGPGPFTVTLSFRMRTELLVVPAGTAVSIRELVLAGLPPRSSYYRSGSVADVLSSSLWPFALPSANSRTLQLLESTVVVHQEELDLLIQALARPNTTRSRADPRVIDEVRVYFTTVDTLVVAFYNETHLFIKQGATPRVSLSNVMLRVPMPGLEEAVGPGLVALGVPYGSGGSSSGVEGWAVGVIVGCVVGGSLLAAAAAYIMTRRRCPQYLPHYKGKYLPTDALPVSEPPPLNGNDLASEGQPSQPAPATLAVQLQPLGPGGTHSSPAPSSGTRHSSVPQPALPAGMGTGLSHSASVTTVTSSNTYSAQQPSIPASSNLGAAGVAPNSSQVVTDSFDMPPSMSVAVARQAAAAGQARDAPSSASKNAAGSTVVSSPSLSSTTNANNIDHMHAIINTLGRDFGESQLSVHSILGKGAYGTVYRGTWRGLQVAIKSMVFAADRAGVSAPERPLLEAAISSNLVHPNIVTTYAYELKELPHEFAAVSPELARQGGGWRLCLIQEYCDAGPLKYLIDTGFFASPGSQPAFASEAPDAYSAGGALSPRREIAEPPALPSSPSVPVQAASAPQHQPIASQGPVLQPTTQLTAPSGSGAVTSAHGHGTSSLPALLLSSIGHGGLPPMPPTSCLQAAARYVEMALMLARGLAHIHAKNIIHGDLNPSNVLLSKVPSDACMGYVCKVADFGLSVRMHEDQSHLSNLFQGTPYYIAPEVVMTGRVSKAADIYALGLLMYELQHGERPIWRRGQRLPTFPSLNTALLAFRADCPRPYVTLAQSCFHGAKDLRPKVEAVVEALTSLHSSLVAAMAAAGDTGSILTSSF